jgi:hypothetical protein
VPGDRVLRWAAGAVDGTRVVSTESLGRDAWFRGSDEAFPERGRRRVIGVAMRVLP